MPQIKVEPSSYLDVDFASIDEKLANGFYGDDWIVDESGKTNFEFNQSKCRKISIMTNFERSKFQFWYR